MLQVFVITKDGSLSGSVNSYLKSTGDGPAHVYRVQGADAMVPSQVPSFFRRIADWLEATAEQNGGLFALREAIAVIDLDDTSLISFEELNPAVVNQGRWAAVVAMLVLAFPEVHWVFDTFYRPLGTPHFGELHLLANGAALREIIAFRRAGFTPLFDCTGLRNAVRESLKVTPESDYVPVRRETAAAIDEEVAYAYFNAYVAYRIGYRVHVISSYDVLTKVLGPGGGWAAAGRPKAPSLIFEDLYLNFPDKPHDIHFSKLRVRDSVHFPGLARADYRVIVTVGHERTADPETEKENREYEEEWRNEGKHLERLYKPLSGIFDAWRESGVAEWLKDNGGQAPHFIWPPEAKSGGQVIGTHSAPGRLLEVSNRLIQRAGAVAKNIQTVPDAVYGALLAHEAQEYLGHRTPTASLEALALGHTLEVSAECLFYGVEYNKDVDSRFREIERDITSISKWLRLKTQRLSSLDAEVGIVSDLVLRFREHYQFDEEQKCLNKLRGLHRKLWGYKNQPWSWPLWPFRWYVESLLSSILVFTLALFLWVVGLSVAFSHNCVVCHKNAIENKIKDAQRPQAQAAVGGAEDAGAPPTPTPDLEQLKHEAEMHIHGWGIEHGLAHSVTTFFGIQPAHAAENLEEHSPWVLTLNALAILAGFTHLGIFVSHLYSLIARR